ncbi:MAG: bifunctional precorrin-2 dehydrogenase/sirohydrochlorin ferrochelatase [Deltaproteobacteria bacterium]|nr:bifunctional precorrin-2 dehydrogenase/sirohydrochlorin ferrochelatase [Deltaproteobacteria bacterium]
MRYYPINLDVDGRNCLVVGGGSVGTRKVKTLLSCGARVTVVSPKISAELRRLLESGQIQFMERTYRSTDLTRMFLVFGASDNEQLNRRIHADATQRNMLCNIADKPAVCNFILPAIVRRGDLVLTVSTSGKSPAFSKKLRKDLEKQFGEEYIEFLRLLGVIREKLLAEKHEPEAHKTLFESLIEQGLLDLVKSGNTQRIDALLRDVLGDGFESDILLNGDAQTR